jgi:hypothetical protein
VITILELPSLSPSVIRFVSSVPVPTSATPHSPSSSQYLYVSLAGQRDTIGRINIDELKSDEDDGPDQRLRVLSTPSPALHICTILTHACV